MTLTSAVHRCLDTVQSLLKGTEPKVLWQTLLGSDVQMTGCSWLNIIQRTLSVQYQCVTEPGFKPVTMLLRGGFSLAIVTTVVGVLFKFDIHTVLAQSGGVTQVQLGAAERVTVTFHCCSATVYSETQPEIHTHTHTHWAELTWCGVLIFLLVLCQLYLCVYQ